MNNPPNNNPQIVHYSSPQLPRSQPQQGNQYNFGNQQNQNKQQNRPISPNYSNQSQPHLRSHNPHQQFSNNQRPVSPPSVAAQYSNVQSNFNFQQQQSTRINNPLHPQENFNNAQQQVHSQHQQFINPPQSSGGFNSFENNMNNQNYSAPQHSGMGNQFLSGDQQFNAAAFLNDPTTQIGMKIGTQALASGQEIVNKNLGKYMSMTHIKYYFNVSNGYVLSKILLLVFPFRHKSWTRLVNRSEQNGEMEGYKVPREDINAPDIYIPVMSFVTYVLLVAVKLGSAKNFKPEVLGLTASSAFFSIFLEVLILKFGFYILNVLSEVPFLDLISYCSYKFVALIFILLANIFSNGNTYFILGTYLYTMGCFGFYTLRTLKYIVLPESTATVVSQGRKRRIHFLFIIAGFQMFSSFLLIRNL